MTNQEIKQKNDNIINLLEKKQLKNAFESIRELIEASKEWIFTEDLDLAETTYKYMLQYTLNGVDDPERDKVYNEILKAMFELLSKIILFLNDKNNTGFYSQNRRDQQSNGILSYEELTESINEEATNISLLDLLEDNDLEVSLNMQTRLENLSGQLFKKIWLSNDLTKDEAGALRTLLQNKLISLQTRCLVISALTLALKEFFNEEKLLLLFEAYDMEEEEIRQRALVGILLVLYTYDKRIYLYPHINNRLSHWMENPACIKNIHTVIRQLILTKETEKISKKISEELIPEMMKITPKLKQRIHFSSLMDDTGINEKNPDWQKMLDKSGLTDKLQEINDLQMEGADVMHSSFANLKTYPFFQEISNWFLPFSPNHSTLNPGNDLVKIINVIREMGYICNSDKYSLCFSLVQIPKAYKEMLSSQMMSEMSEMIKQEKENRLILNNKQAETISNQYIHDLYRFYKVHPRRKDFDDIFTTPLTIHKTQSIGQFIADKESLQSIGEYYFSKNHLKDAKEIFVRLSQKECATDAVLFQKIGYCEQMEGNIDRALTAYLRSDLMASGNPWTLKKIASCYRLLKKPEEALAYYQKIKSLNPDNLSVVLNIGHCYLELKKYDEALKSYFKVEYLNSNSSKSWRPIAWCSFLSGKFEQANHYYEKILDDQPKMIDYINYGHTMLAMKNRKKAIDLYKLAVEAPQGSTEKFIQIIEEDTPELIHVGINENDIPILIDQVLYAIK
jgi:tetratricopeptide (TPR) repeat protein